MCHEDVFLRRRDHLIIFNGFDSCIGFFLRLLKKEFTASSGYYCRMQRIFSIEILKASGNFDDCSDEIGFGDINVAIGLLRGYSFYNNSGASDRLITYFVKSDHKRTI